MTYRTRLKCTDEMKPYIWGRYQEGDAIKGAALCHKRVLDLLFVRFCDDSHSLRR